MELRDALAASPDHIVEDVTTTEITYTRLAPTQVRFECPFNPKLKPGDWVRFRDYRSRGYRDGRVRWVTHLHNYHDSTHTTEVALDL